MRREKEGNSARDRYKVKQRERGRERDRMRERLRERKGVRGSERERERKREREREVGLKMWEIKRVGALIQKGENTRIK